MCGNERDENKEGRLVTRCNYKQELTLSLSNRGGRGDGACVRRVRPGHGHRVADPRRGVDWSDRLICARREEFKESSYRGLQEQKQFIPECNAAFSTYYEGE